MQTRKSVARSFVLVQNRALRNPKVDVPPSRVQATSPNLSSPSTPTSRKPLPVQLEQSPYRGRSRHHRKPEVRTRGSKQQFATKKHKKHKTDDHKLICAFCAFV